MTEVKLKAVLAAVIATLAIPVYAEDPPRVIVTNPTSSPVPVTVTNPSTGNANVTVTNPATNPVKTTEAYPRIPVRILLTNSTSYTVPAGFRLEMETIFAEEHCTTTPEEAPGHPNIGFAPGPTFAGSLPITLQKMGINSTNPDVTNWVGVHEIRVVVEPGERFAYGDFNCPTYQLAVVEGYLISIDSPSGAP